MTTGLEIITKAMQKVGILIKSESPASDEAADALDALNDLIASWSTESMLIYARTLESFTLAGGTSSYTIGSGQTFNTVRPLMIIDSYIRNSTIDTNVAIVPDEVFANITNKTTQGIPEFLNYDNAFPTGTIKLWPVPSSAYTLFISSEKELSSLTLAGTVSLPAGWKRALIYNLALELAPEYGQSVDEAILKHANESKRNIKATIMRNRSMDANATPSLGFNVYSGY